jgi:hypothetical protein
MRNKAKTEPFQACIDRVAVGRADLRQAFQRIVVRIRHCRWCGQVFYARRSNMRFCSRQCASRAALVRYATRSKSGK